MNKKELVGIYGLIITVILAISNLQSLFFTICLVIEQIQTGMGFGTLLEMFTLMVWISHLICFPAILGSIGYFILHIMWSSDRRVLIANIALFSFLVFQILITNLFILI
ncbi:MAG: hypothetical protein IJX78_05075 [Bacilli bacterium]|nr:hypothetical protein [Bacilli bacterium]